MKRLTISADLYWLFVLLVVFCVLAFQIASHAPDEADTADVPHHTTTSSQKTGWKAFYQTLQQTGDRAVDRWTRGGPTTWPDNAAVIICGPAYADSQWSDDEARAALAWVARGGTLVLFATGADRLTIAAHLAPRDGEESRPLRTYVPAQPAPFIDGVSAVVFPQTSAWSESDANDGISLLSGKHKVAVAFGRGKGLVVALASATIADNENIGKADNARFLCQLINSMARPTDGAAGGSILFDEFHQGFADQNSLWTVIGRPGRLAVYQLLALALMFAFSISRRFGLPRPTPEASRVSNEYVSSLANLYQRARASDAALDSIYKSFRRDLSAGTGYASDTELEELIPAILSGLGLKASDPVALHLRELMDICEAKIKAGANAVPEAELIQLTRKIGEMRKELRLGGINRG